MRKKNKMKKEMVKRISAFMLVATMCVSACPTAVMAEESPSVDNNIIKNDENGIPDKVLYEYLLENGDGTVDGNKDGKLSIEEGEKIQWLQIYLKGEQDKVESFKNLSKYAPNIGQLTYADWRSEEIKEADAITLKKNDLEEIAALSALGMLRICDMNLKDTSVLSKINTLEVLEFEGCSIPNMDFLNEENYSQLYYLNLDDTSVEKIPNAVSSMKDMYYLNLRNCGVKELPDMKDFKELKADSLVLDGNLLTAEELRAKLPAQITDEQITKIAEEQKQEVECTLSVDPTEIQYGDTVKATITIKNVGMPVENLYVEVRENGKPYFPTTDADKTTENGIYMESLAYGESKTLTYEITMKDLRNKMYLNVGVKTEDYSINWSDYKEITVELPKAPEIDGDTQEPETDGDMEDNYDAFDVKIKDIKVSNKNVVLTDDNRYEEVTITVSLEGEDVASIPENGRFYIYIQKKDAKDTDSVYSLNTIYNAQKKQIEGTLLVSGHLLSTDYVLTTVYISDADGYLTNLINSYTGDKTAFRVTKKTTDQEAPVINAVQVFVNDTLQKTGTITLKKGDVITVRADVDDKNKVSGIFLLMGKDYTYFSGQMNPSAYDLEGKLTCNGTTVPEGTFSLYYVGASDWYGNQKYYYEDDVVALFKEVKPNPQNAVLLKNQDTVKGLDNIKANLAELIEMEGAVSDTTKTAIKAALEAGKEVTPEISVSSVPATSIESDVRANVQAKADAVFGANTKVAYLDISLNLLVDGSSYGLNQLKEPISITVTLPEELKGDYNYKVIRSHKKAEGTTETEVLDAVKNADGTITFKTDRFSTYAIAYSTNEAKGTNGTTGTKSPGTNDMNIAIIYFTLVAAVVACATFEKKRRA